MKFKTTKKEINNNFGIVLNISYCGAQNLLAFQNPIAYTTGTYGWNADIYTTFDFAGTAIVTGYRPFGTKVDYDTLKKFEDAAEKINHDYDLDYDTRKRRINDLLTDFVVTEIDRIRR